MPQKYIAAENNTISHKHQVIGFITFPLENGFLGSDAQNCEEGGGPNLLCRRFYFPFE